MFERRYVDFLDDFPKIDITILEKQGAISTISDEKGRNVCYMHYVEGGFTKQRDTNEYFHIYQL